MIIHYVDPSAWVKRHFRESGSDAVNELFRAPVAAACCRLGLVEMTATIVRKGFHESLDQRVIAVLLENVRADFAAFRMVSVDEPCISRATELAIRHRLRTIDALHLASALSLRSLDEIVMVSSDVELLSAAEQEGIATINPAVPKK